MQNNIVSSVNMPLTDTQTNIEPISKKPHSGLRFNCRKKIMQPNTLHAYTVHTDSLTNLEFKINLRAVEALLDCNNVNLLTDSHSCLRWKY